MQNIKDQLNTIVKLFNSGEKQIALNKISLLLQTNQKNIELFLLHAKICINLNKIDDAKQDYQNYIKFTPNAKDRGMIERALNEM